MSDYTWRATFHPTYDLQNLYKDIPDWLWVDEIIDKNSIDNTQFEFKIIRNHFITRRNTQPTAQINIKQFGMGIDPYKSRKQNQKQYKK